MDTIITIALIVAIIVVAMKIKETYDDERREKYWRESIRKDWKQNPICYVCKLPIKKLSEATSVKEFEYVHDSWRLCHIHRCEKELRTEKSNREYDARIELQTKRMIEAINPCSTCAKRNRGNWCNNYLDGIPDYVLRVGCGLHSSTW